MEIKRIPPVYSPQELVDIAFRRASKEAKKVQIKNSRLRKKRAEERRVKESSQYIISYLSRIEKLKVRIEDAPTFYLELLEIMVGVKKISASVERLTWAKNKISKLADRMRREIRMSKGDPVLLRKEFYGKTSSILEKIKPELEFLGGVIENIKNFPTIKEGFTAVIAGMPNVGKSSLLKQLTSSKPEIRSYPFTTQSILLGYVEEGHKRFQIIDTPGILDRPIEERNPVERQAILSLKNLADIILFVFDPSETCGFTVESQLELYAEINSNFKKVIPVFNKIDLADKNTIRKLENKIEASALKCSALDGWVSEVRDFILQASKKSG
jgi:nucleolar GTP-binding protein